MINNCVANGPWTGIVAAANSLSPKLAACKVMLSFRLNSLVLLCVDHIEGVDERIKEACRAASD
eukprot:3639197-Rhodomonas_salina.3